MCAWSGNNMNTPGNDLSPYLLTMSGENAPLHTMDSQPNITGINLPPPTADMFNASAPRLSTPPDTIDSRSVAKGNVPQKCKSKVPSATAPSENTIDPHHLHYAKETDPPSGNPPCPRRMKIQYFLMVLLLPFARGWAVLLFSYRPRRPRNVEGYDLLSGRPPMSNVNATPILIGGSSLSVYPRMGGYSFSVSPLWLSPYAPPVVKARSQVLSVTHGERLPARLATAYDVLGQTRHAESTRDEPNVPPDTPGNRIISDCPAVSVSRDHKRFWA